MLRLFTLISLIWCSLHIAEPAAAHGATPAEHAMFDAAGSDPVDDGADPDVPLHGGHHHCPMAPDQSAAAGRAFAGPVSSFVFAGKVIPLASLTRPPPLRPPSVPA